MRYLLLVSHGTFAPGLHSVLKMLSGDRDDVLSCSLEDGMGADQYVENLKKVIEPIGPEDEVLVLGDIIGGSPLTNALKTLSDKGMIARTSAFGGMNLPMALTAVLQLQTDDLPALKQSMVSEAREAAKELELETPSADDEDDI